MKKIILTLCLIGVTSTCFAKTTTTYIYNGKGEKVGYVRETDVNTQIYDGNGHYKGRITKNPGGSRTAWGRDGEYLGHSTCVGGCNTEEKGEDD